MTKNEVEKFLNTHRDRKISAAKLECMNYLNPAFEPLVLKSYSNARSTPEDIEAARLIENACTAEELVKLMRKGLSGQNRYDLRQKLLQNEELVMQRIREKSLSYRQDVFVENALYFFLRCRENVCSWIIENYSAIKCEYMKEMLCLVIGFRGEEEMIPFLISEAERMERDYPYETYDQGPFIAVGELANRYMELQSVLHE